MTADTADDRLRRRLLAVADAHERLQVEADRLGEVRRRDVGDEWLADLEELVAGRPAGATPAAPPFLVRGPKGRVHLIDDGCRRLVPSGLLADALEAELGDRRKVDAAELDAWPEGPPVEVLESSDGPSFLVIGGRRRPVRGLPLPYPVSDERAVRFETGDELDVAQVRKASDAAARPDLPPLPTFLIIGAQKSATRWLRSNLGRHPDVYAAATEIEFFNNDDHYDNQGVNWYRAQFAAWSGEPIVGEATPGYMMWRHQPEVMARRMHDVVPEVRLIAILRNPIERAYSAMVHHMKRERLPANADLLELARATPPEQDFLGLIAGGWYAASLRPFVRRFGDQLLVLLHDDIAEDAPGVYARAADHIGADPAFVPPNLAKVRFSNRDQADRERDPLTPEARRELWELFRSDVDSLAELLGRDLSAWDPTASTRATPAGTA